MPMTLNVGLSRKLGLPDYGSLGASCNVTVELDAALLRDDLDGFHAEVRNAYTACRQAPRPQPRAKCISRLPEGHKGRR
jgi:hypothetical protein